MGEEERECSAQWGECSAQWGSAVHLNEEEASAVQKSERPVHLGHHQVQAGHSRGLAHNSTASHVSVVNLVLLPPQGVW